MELDPSSCFALQFASSSAFTSSFRRSRSVWLRGSRRSRARVWSRATIYRRVFDFWIKIFALSFGMGVVTGVVMAFQFGTNWGVLAQRTGSIQGPLLGYEQFTAFTLEVTFFGVVLLGRDRVSPRFYSSPAAWFRSARCSRRSGFSRTTAGCRRRSAHDRRWPDRSRGLAGDRARARDDGALAAHAARCIPDDRHVRGGHRRLVCVAEYASC